MIETIREFTAGFSDLYWFGYIVTCIGALALALGGMAVICYTIYGFGIVVVLAEIASGYYQDYFCVRPEQTTEETTN